MTVHERSTAHLERLAWGAFEASLAEQVEKMLGDGLPPHQVEGFIEIAYEMRAADWPRLMKQIRDIVTRELGAPRPTVH